MRPYTTTTTAFYTRSSQLVLRKSGLVSQLVRFRKEVGRNGSMDSELSGGKLCVSFVCVVALPCLATAAAAAAAAAAVTSVSVVSKRQRKEQLPLLPPLLQPAQIKDNNWIT